MNKKDLSNQNIKRSVRLEARGFRWKTFKLNYLTKGFEKFNPEKEIYGISIGGRDTTFNIKRYHITMDAGESIVKLNPENMIFISHTDFDHYEGLAKLMKKEKKREFDIYISENAYNRVEKLKNDLGRERKNFHFHFINEKSNICLDNHTKIEFFKIIHFDDSIGICILQGDSEGGWRRILTYTGDLSLSLMKNEGLINEELLNTETLIIECSAIKSKKKLLRIEEDKHTALDDIYFLITHNKVNIKNLVLVHMIAMPPIPMMVEKCYLFENDILSYFSNSNLNVFYLTACREIFDIKDDFMHPIKVI